MTNIIGKNISKVYDHQIHAVCNVDFTIQHGEFLVIVGPSGSGKTTLLKMIAGLESITEGTLLFDEHIMNDTSPDQRNISMVFQSYALFPHLSVYDNIAIGTHPYDKEALGQQIHETAQLLGIETLLNRKPTTLSGGQQQRVSIARALVRNSELVLMDEPLSNLDGPLRIQMRQELLKIHKEVSTTFIYVTHDFTEAMTLADRIIVMSDGNIQQIGTPYELYHSPKNTFIAQFLGYPVMNLCRGTLKNHNISIFQKNFSIKCDHETDVIDVIVGIRPEDVHIVESFSAILFHIDMIEHLGDESILHGYIDQKEFQVKTSTWFLDTKKDCYITFTTFYIFDKNTNDLLGTYEVE